MALTRRFHEFFFAPQSPFDLGICRAIFFGICFFHYSNQSIYLWGDIAPSLWQPIWTFKVFGIPALGAEILRPLFYVWLIALAMASLGVLTKLATITSAAIGFYMISLSQCWGKVDHDDAAVLLTMLLLALSRCGDAVSLDTLGRKNNPQPSGEYRWPIRFVWVTLSLVFFAAGMAKLRISGFEWAWSENMRVLMVRRQYISPHLDESVLWIAQTWWLPRLMAASVMFFEAGYPLALFSRRLRLVFVPGLIMSVIGFKYMISPDFRQLLYLSLFWVPWGQLIERVRKWPATANLTTSRSSAQLVRASKTS